MSARVKAFILLDLIGSKNQKIDKDFASNTTLCRIFKQAATNMGEEKRMYEFESTMTDDHIPFKKRGIRVIDLIDFHSRAPGEPKDPRYAQWWHTAEDDLPAMDPASLDFVHDLIVSAIPILEAEFFK